MASHQKQATFSPGDTIVESFPWVYSPLTSTVSSVCYRCFKNGPERLRRCTGCYFAHYCGQRCQKLDWTDRHKHECKVILTATQDQTLMSVPELMDIFSVLCKILIKLKNNHRSDDQGNCKPETTRTFDDLMSHSADLQKLPSAAEIYRLYAQYINLLDTTGAFCSNFEDFTVLYGRFLINGFMIADYFKGELGRALYLGPSIFDHSCEPNAVQTFDGLKVLVKAIEPITSLDDVRISYTHTFQTPKVRQAFLEQSYFFTCNCRICTDQTVLALRDAIKCPSCSNAVPFTRSQDTASCESCGPLPISAVREARRVLDSLDDSLSRSNSMQTDSRETLAELSRFLSVGRNLLHETNFSLGVAFRTAYWLSAAVTQTDVTYLERALPSLRNHVNGFESTVTGTLAELFHNKLDKGEYERAMDYGRQLMERLTVIPGSDSLVAKEYSAVMVDCQRAILTKTATRF